jgi:hypothetical protein
MTTFRTTHVGVCTSSSPTGTVSILVLFETNFVRWQFFNCHIESGVHFNSFCHLAFRRQHFFVAVAMIFDIIIHTAGKPQYTSVNWQGNSPRTQRCVFRDRRVKNCRVHTFRFACVIKVKRCLHLSMYGSGPATGLILDLYSTASFLLS